MYVCALCEQNFDSVDALSAHLIFFHRRLHSDSFTCFQCKRSFRELYAFKRHLNKGHFNVGGGNINLINENVNEPVVDDGAEDQPDRGVDGSIADEQNVDGESIDDNDDPILTLENFVHSLYQNVQQYVAQLYQIPSVNRKLVDKIVNATSELISDISQNLKKNVFKFIDSFEDVPNDYHDNFNKLDSMFQILSDPFEGVQTEHQRFKTLLDSGSYIPPNEFEMGHDDKYEKVGNTVHLVRTPVYGQFVPMRQVLKTFLELPNVFCSITEYLEKLSHQGKISNFVQGTLWKHQCSAFAEGQVVLPLNIEFDDFEPDNVLGSHHGSHSFGALYAVLPCLPPEHQSALDNIFLFCLFESKHRKMFGNEMAFSRVIEELTYLGEEGILVNICGQEIRVYFCLCIIIADNLGNNAIQGFIECFRGNYFCRLCKLHRNEMSVVCTAVPDQQLRTVQNYREDLAVGDSSLTGIKEECIFNAVPNYHCVQNGNCDVMHDLFEGMLVYDLCNILYYFVSVRGYLDLDWLKNRIDAFDYGPSDVGNRPPTLHCSLSSLENCSWNLSSSEYLCLGRYLCLMIGDLIPAENRVWKFYLIVREIVEIMTSPVIDENLPMYLQTLVQEHHEMYLELFGPLKPKHHFMVHHPYLMKQNGPLIHLSSLMCERNHRRGKLYSRVNNSRVNPALSVAIKFQLMLSERLSRSENFSVCIKTYKVNRVRVDSVPQYISFAESLPFDSTDIVSSVKKVEVAGTLYSLNMVLVLEVGELLPKFGRVVNILVEGDNVFFCYERVKLC